MKILNQIAKGVNSIFGRKNQPVTIRAKDIATPKAMNPDTMESVRVFEAEIARLQNIPVPAQVPQEEIPAKQAWEIQLENMPTETRYILGKFLMAPSKDYTGMKDLLTTYDTNEKLVAYLNTKPGIRNTKRVGRHYTLESIINEHEE